MHVNRVKNLCVALIHSWLQGFTGDIFMAVMQSEGSLLPGMFRTAMGAIMDRHDLWWKINPHSVRHSQGYGPEASVVQEAQRLSKQVRLCMHAETCTFIAISCCLSDNRLFDSVYKVTCVAKYGIKVVTTVM